MIQIPDREFQTVEVIDPYTGMPRKCFLVKYEKKRYGTIRIGTLTYYRGIEANQGDPMDGCVEGVLFEPEEDTSLTRHEMLAISNGQLDLVARGGINFKAGAKYKDESRREHPNIYVFCCSMEFGVFPNKERNNHFRAEEFFILDNPIGFREMIALELQRRARTTDGNYFDPKKHYFRSWEAPVRYLTRMNARIEIPINHLDHLVYQKDPKFAIEQEYRFVWGIFDKRTDVLVEIAHDPIDIPIVETRGTAHVKFE